MWKKQEETNLLTQFILIFVFTAHLLDTARALSDKRLCADEKCKEIISMGIGKINYRAGEYGMISFGINSDIRIKSKSAGSNPNLWGIEVGGREGYAPKELIRETKIIKKEKDLKFIVDVEPKKSINTLATSEKLLEKENTEESTTTPLNFSPTESTENPVKSNTNKTFIPGYLPVATTVLSEIVDGTEIPVFENDDGNSENNKEDRDEQDKQVENSQDIEVSDSNNNLLKESADQVNDKSINKEKITESFTEPEENTESSNAETQKDEIKVDTKTIEDTANHEFSKKLPVFSKSSGEETKHTKGDENVNIEVVDKKDLTQKLSSVTETESVEGNSQENSLVNEEHKTTQNGDRSQTNEKSSDNMKETTIDAMKDGSKISEEGKSNREYFPELAIFSKNSVEKTKQTTQTQNIVNIEVVNKKYSVQNQNSVANVETVPENAQQITSDSEKDKTTTEKYDKTHADVSNTDDTVVYNSTDSNTDANKDNTKITKNQEISSETETNINLKNISSADNSVYQQEVAQTVKYNNEDPVQKFKTDEHTEIDSLTSLPRKTVFPFYEMNMVKEPVITESSTASNTDKKHETYNNPPQTEDISNSRTKIPVEVLSEKEIREETSFEKKQLSSENNLDKNKTTYALLESYKSNISIDNMKGVEEVSNSKENMNSENFHNQQKLQTEQAYEETPTEQVQIDKEIENKESFSTEAKTPINAELVTSPNSDEEEHTSTDSFLDTEELNLSTTPQMTEQVLNPEKIVQANFNPTTYNPNDDIPSNTPLSTEIDYSYQDVTTTNIRSEDSQESSQEGSPVKQTTESYSSVPTISSDAISHSFQGEGEPKALPSSTPFDDFEVRENKGLFATIMGTVNNMWSTNKKNKQNEFDGDRELNRILFSKKNNVAPKIEKLNEENSLLYCKNIGPNGDCPEGNEIHESPTSHFHQTDLNLDNFLKSLASKILEMSELLAFLVIVAAATLFFLFGYYCFCNSSREGALLSKLNQLESSLLASHKENAILKHNLMSTRQKLASIEDNSFGSNDMVVSLKKELEEELMEKARLQEQITVLQKELENAADAGIELNKIVSELLSNQTGDESIISSVEELQKQLNEQQKTIFEINASLAEKSRENSELQLLIAEQNARYETELANVHRDNDELEHEKGNLLTRLDELKNDFDKDITAALEGKNLEIKRLQNEILDLTNKLEKEHTKWQTSVAKIEALEECLTNVRRDPKVNIAEVIDVANVKAQLIEIRKKYKSLTERHETELDSRKLAENQLEMVSGEVEKLKQDFNQSEKDKLEAQTRLEVLSNYFKDKENQLQKELSLKEAMWLKQQGETTTTVDRLTAMQEEIQSLKSQNDSLRAEIEAQVAAHKAQTGTLENRAHETWLAARQSDRRYEEARAEATALRRKLTALAGGNVNEVNKPSAGSAALGDDLTQAPSPIHMESPGSPMLGRMLPPTFLPPPFMGHPPPFMGMPPPPPLLPPCEMRPAPLGRIMSPPPQRSGRFSPQHLDYDDYLDYESNNTWHRHTYSPPPRTYRSLSPSDSRYNYGAERDLMSTYDTEADYSPPPSPRESRRSNGKNSYGNTNKFNTSSKGPLSSGSEKSFNTSSHNETKTKKGSTSSGGGKSFV